MSSIGPLPTRGRPYGIRFESVGGLGADSAAQALAAAAVLKMGLDAAHLRAGRIERKGARVRSFVQLVAREPMVRIGAPSPMADAIVVFHPALLRDCETLGGLRKEGMLIYNAPAKTTPEGLAALPATARAIRVDAAGIAAKEKCAMAVPLMGAVCAAADFIDADAVMDSLCADESSRKGFRRGASECETLADMGEAEGDLPASADFCGAGVVSAPGNSIWNDLSTARSGFLPAFNRERCIHCAMCDMVCPDLCLVWEEGEQGGRFQRELTGVDYRYCKGCLRCVETCPASAMLKKAETPGLAERLSVPLFPELLP